MHKLSALLFFSLLPLLTSAQRTLDGDPTGFGCSACLLLDNPAELVPCSDAWRQLMGVCSTPACASYANYVSKAPPVSSCTSTPNPLPGGTASAGISFSFISGSRGSNTATGGPVFTSASRSMGGPGTTTTRGAGTETGTTTTRGAGAGAGTVSRDGSVGGSSTTATPGSNNSTVTGGNGSISGTAIAEPTLTGTNTGVGPQSTNSGFVTATGGVGRVVAGSLGFGWLWEAVFMFWGAAW